MVEYRCYCLLQQDIRSTGAVVCCGKRYSAVKEALGQIRIHLLAPVALADYSGFFGCFVSASVEEEFFSLHPQLRKPVLGETPRLPPQRRGSVRFALTKKSYLVLRCVLTSNWSALAKRLGRFFPLVPGTAKKGRVQLQHLHYEYGAKLFDVSKPLRGWKLGRS